MAAVCVNKEVHTKELIVQLLTWPHVCQLNSAIDTLTVCRDTIKSNNFTELLKDQSGTIGYDHHVWCIYHDIVAFCISMYVCVYCFVFFSFFLLSTCVHGTVMPKSGATFFFCCT